MRGEMNEKCFLLDTNCFITPCNTFYPFSFAPAYWDVILQEQEKGRICTIEEVREEIFRKEDQIKSWMESNVFSKDFFRSMDECAMKKFSEIINWVYSHPVFSNAEKEKFSSQKTDGFLVSYAGSRNIVLVTLEKRQPDPKCKKIKIPNLCEQFQVESIDLFEMLKRLGVSFVLG